MDAAKKRSERPELYNLTVYRYDYATGETSTCNYFRNPFCHNADAWRITENEPTDMLGFFPSITRDTAGYA